jgi:hypothetical protein
VVRRAEADAVDPHMLVSFLTQMTRSLRKTRTAYSCLRR